MNKVPSITTPIEHRTLATTDDILAINSRLHEQH